MAKNKDTVKFEDEVGLVLANLIKDTKKKKLTQSTWRGLVGDETYKITIFMANENLSSIKIEKR